MQIAGKSIGGLAANIAGAVVLACAANAFVFLLNPAEELAPSKMGFDPPGYVVGIVWIGLFIALGVARWLTVSAEPRAARLIVTLLLFCAAYPLYTLGLRSETIGLVGNFATGVFALLVAKRLQRSSRLAAGLVSLVTLWVSLASILTLSARIVGAPGGVR